MLEHDWAYGARGTKLHGKFMMQAISTGGPEHFYKPQGKNRFEIGSMFKTLNDPTRAKGVIDDVTEIVRVVDAVLTAEVSALPNP